YQVFANAYRFRSGPTLRRQPWLDQLDVPIAELAPEKVVDAVGSLVEAVSFERLIDIVDHAVEARKNPAILQASRFESAHPLCSAGALARGLSELFQRPDTGLLRRVHTHEHETSCIPDLIGKITIPLSSIFRKCNVGARGSHGCQREARGIGPEALDDVDRVDHIPLGFGHLLALGIPYQRVNIDLAERHTVVLLIGPSTGLLQLRILPV